MSDKTKVALILAGALLFAAFLNGGIYQIVAQRFSDDMAIAYRLNRFTGEVTAVIGWHYVPIKALPSPTATPTSSP